MRTSEPCRTGPTGLPDAVWALRASWPQGRPAGHARTAPPAPPTAMLSEDTLVPVQSSPHPPSSVSTWFLLSPCTALGENTRRVCLSSQSCPLASCVPSTGLGLACSLWYPGPGTREVRQHLVKGRQKELSAGCGLRTLPGGRLEPFSFPILNKTLAGIRDLATKLQAHSFKTGIKGVFQNPYLLPTGNRPSCHWECHLPTKAMGEGGGVTLPTEATGPQGPAGKLGGVFLSALTRTHSALKHRSGLSLRSFVIKPQPDLDRNRLHRRGPTPGGSQQKVTCMEDANGDNGNNHRNEQKSHRDTQGFHGEKLQNLIEGQIRPT